MKKMKTNITLPRRLAAAAVLLVVASGSFAQKNIEAAFASFKSEKAVTISESRSRETDPATGQLKERTEGIDFSLDASKKNLIDKLCAAFDRDRDASYNEFSHTGNGRSPQPILIGNEISVGVGKNMNYVVMAFADKQTAEEGKPINRTVYAMEWAKDAKDGKTITGTLYVVYGPIPQKRSVTITRAKTIGSAPDAIRRYEESLKGLDFSNLGQTLGDVGSVLADLRLGDFGLLADSLAASSSQSTLQPWLYLFRMQTRGYRKAVKQGKDVTYYLTSLLEHCKKEHASLTDDELKLCMEELHRLLDITKDDFDRALLEECIALLKKG